MVAIPAPLVPGPVPLPLASAGKGEAMVRGRR